VLQDEFTAATYNNPELTRRIAAELKTALGNDNVVQKIQAWALKIFANTVA
jgi:hypothetical protein